MEEKEKKIPEIELDKEGKFKYIQIKITSKEKKDDERIILQGTASCKYHNDIYKAFTEKYNITENDKYNYEVLGGGKMEIKDNKIHIHGESSVYGPCDHELTSKMLEKHFGKGKYEITWEKGEEKK